MKYLKFIFLSIFIFLILVSCSSFSDYRINENISQYRPTTITFYDSLTNEKQKSKILHYSGKFLTSIDVQDANDSITETITFEYDGDKLIKKVLAGPYGNSIFEYYDNGKLESKTEPEDDRKYRYKNRFTYDGKNIIKVETYSYYNGVKDSEFSERSPHRMYEYFYNSSKQLISRIEKYKNHDTGEWKTYEIDTLLYTNNKVSQYSSLHSNMNYFFTYDINNRLTNVSVNANSHDIADALFFVYDDGNVVTMFSKNSHDNPKLKIDIEWEKQESNVFEVSRFLILEAPLSIISDYFNLFLYFVIEM